MTHASLFSGIGGFDLAAEWMGFPTDWMLAPFLNGLRSTNDGDSAVGGAENPSKPMATQ